MTTLPLKPDKSLADIDAIGLTAKGFIKTSDLILSDDVRTLCERNQCRKYGSSWACPPGAGTVEECKQRLLSYSQAMVFACVYPLEDSFDIEGMQAASVQFKRICEHLHDLLQPPFLMLGNEGCHRCLKCTYPEAPCRHPEKLIYSLSGYCIIANKMAESAGIPYIAGENTVSYFGLICYNE